MGTNAKFSDEVRLARKIRMTGRKVSDEEKRATSERHKGKEIPEETRKKQSKTRIERGLAAGSNNVKARKINIYNKDGDVMFECNGSFYKTIKDNGLSLTLKATLAKGTFIKD